MKYSLPLIFIFVHFLIYPSFAEKKDDFLEPFVSDFFADYLQDNTINGRQWKSFNNDQKTSLYSRI